MAYSEKFKQKQKQKAKDIEMEEAEMVAAGPSSRSHSRTSSISSLTDDVGTPRMKRKIMMEKERDGSPEVVLRRIDGPKNEMGAENCTLVGIRKERIELEEYLFNEVNKVNKVAIKYILEKWSKLEGRLQEQLLENERLKIINRTKVTNKVKTYAQMTSTLPFHPRKFPETEQRRVKKDNYEVILIKPEKEDDKRNNEAIKEEVLKHLGEVRGKLKVRNIRQMKKKGIVMEVKDNEDVDTIKKAKLEKIGLRVDKPQKIKPSLIIYDVEKENKVEDLKEDFIIKNFSTLPEKEIEYLRSGVIFSHSFKGRENSLNWIVQIPGKYFENLINRKKVYMLWRMYNIREYINVARCFKCHGYGHIAKYCSIPDQLCEICGSKDHLKNVCPRKENPECVNCSRARRKETKHGVRSKECPEYRRHVELYRNKIEWS